MDRELRGTVGYVRAGRMVVLYNLSLLCWLRPENFLSAPLSYHFIFSSLSTVTVRSKFQAQDFSFACVGNVVDDVDLS